MKRLVSLVVTLALVINMIPMGRAAVAQQNTPFVPQIRMATQAYVTSVPAISGDGRYTVFETTDSDLVEGDTNNDYDVFVYDAQTGNVTLASVSSTGEQGNYFSGSYTASRPAISADGRYVAFASGASNLAPGDTDTYWDVFVHDMVSGNTTLASVNSDGQKQNKSSPYDPGTAMSSDGRYIAFNSPATNLAPGISGQYSPEQVYIHDMVSGNTTLLSISSTGEVGNQDSYNSVMSADGRYVAFQSTASNLVAGDTNNNYDVFVHDTQTNETIQVSVSSTGVSGNGMSYKPAISADGRYIYFNSEASNLIPNDSNGAHMDLFVHDMQTRETTIVSVDSDGYPLYGDDWFVSLSADGRYMALTTDGWPNANWGPGAYHEWYYTPDCVFVRDLETGTTTQVSVAYTTSIYPSNRQANGTSYHGVISGDGNYVAFVSHAGNLVASDPDGIDWNLFIAALDREPPTWPEGSALTAQSVGETMLTLNWTPAQDDWRVYSYRIYGDDAITELWGGTVSVTAETLSYFVQGLVPNTQYSFRVEALDGYQGNLSVNGPILTVRTASAEQGNAVLSATARAGGLADLIWDPATPGSGAAAFRIYRSTGGEAAMMVAELPGTTTLTYRDSGLAADTTFTYQIWTVDASDTEQPHTAPVSVTTPPLQAISALSWQIPQANNHLAKLGSPVTISLSGEPNRQVEATVGFQTWLADNGTLLDEPRSTQSTIALPQSVVTPGAYRGTFNLDYGISQLDSLDAVMSDGAGHEVFRTMTLANPVKVSGSIVVEITTAGDLTGDKLIAWSDASQSGDQVDLTIGGNYTLSGLKAANDYSVRVLRDDGRVRVEQTGVGVVLGLETDLSFNPPLSGWVHLLVLDPEGSGLPNTGVVFNDASTGDYLGWARTDSEGLLTALQKSLSGDVIRATPQVTLPYQGVPGNFTLAEGQNEVSIQVERLPEGTLSGNVTSSVGEAMQGAVITASQTVDGRSFTRTTTADADGNYSLTLFAGEARVEAASLVSSHASETATISISANAATSQDFVLSGLGPGTISLAINTHRLGEGWQPVNLDWSTAVKYKLEVNGATITGAGYPVPIRGKAGDTIEVTVDGSWCNLPKQTVQVVLDDQCSATATFDLEETGVRLHGRVLYASGMPARGWHPVTYVADASGRWAGVFLPISEMTWNERALTEYLEVGIKTPGRYQIRIDPPDPYPSMLTYNGLAVPMEIIEIEIDQSQIDAGELIDAGDIVMDVGRFTDTMHLSGPTTDLTFIAPEGETDCITGPERAGPGSQITFRAAYYNVGITVTNNVTMLLDIPVGTSLMTGSVIVNGQPAAYSSDGAILEVSLGTVEAWESGIVYYQVRLDRELGAQTLTVTGTIRYRLGASEIDLEHLMGRAEVLVPGVTMDAPKLLTELTTRVSGRAPALGYMVRVYDDRVFLGESPVSSGGIWQLDVSLPYTGDPQWHSVRAEMDTDTGKLYSKRIAVLYDPDQPVLTEFILSKGYYLGDTPRDTMAIDPTRGVGRFPYPYPPDGVLYVEMRFNEPDLVRDVRVKLSSGISGDATLGADGVHRAVLELGQGKPGSISVTYSKKPSPSIFKESAPTADELRWKLPYPANEFEVVSVTQADYPNTSTGSMEFNVGNFNIQANMTMESVSDYVPSLGDIAHATNSGIPVYGYSFDYAVNSDGVVGNIVGYVPAEVVDTVGAEAALNYLLAAATPIVHERPSASMSVASASEVTFFVKLVANFSLKTIEGFFNSGTFAWDITQALGSGGSWQTFIDLQDMINDFCSDCPDCQDRMQADLRDLMKLWGAEQVSGLLLGVAGTFLAPETFGLGTIAIYGIQQAISWKLDDDLSNRIHALRMEVYDCLVGDEPPPPEIDDWELPVADPVWLIDPSGYVYEAMPENRLEGVTATLLYRDNVTEPWLPWDASWFGQTNPLTTDEEGKYAWDVPEGTWKVAYEKEGYEIAYSEELPVPPPQLDVNIELISLAAPSVNSVVAAQGGGSVDITFDKYVRLNTVTSDTIRVLPVGEDTEPVAGNLSADSAVDYQGTQVSRSFRFVADIPMVGGAEYTIQIGQLVQSYARTPMESDYQTNFTIEEIPAPPPPPPSGGGGFGGFGGGGGAPTGPGVTNLTIYTNSEGLFNLAGEAKSEDGNVRISIAKGVTARTKDDAALKSIKIVPIDSPADLPSGQELIGLVYEITPEGATFSPPVTLVMYYDPANLPQGIDPNSLTIMTYNPGTSSWETLVSTNDNAGSSVSAQVEHLSVYALVGKTAAPPTTPAAPTSVPTAAPTTQPAPSPTAGPAPTTRPALTPSLPVTTPAPEAPRAGVGAWVWILIALAAGAVGGFVAWRLWIRKKPQAPVDSE